MIHFEEIQGRLHLHMTVQRMGCDFSVALYGGDAHVGAVALGLPKGAGCNSIGVGNSNERCNAGNANAYAASTRGLTVPGHREEALACSIAQHLASALQARVCVACGIHLDSISTDEIAAVLRLAESLTHKAIAALTNTP